MASDGLKQKPSEKHSFDDELGDDFLSAWKPNKSLAATALDFDEDEPAPKNRKASFSLAKMDMDFDFDGGLNALSNFNVDMSDLEFPISLNKTSKAKGSSQEKQVHNNTKKGDSKFSFQFNGFDDLDLDDTLKTSKGPETSMYTKKVETDFSPPSSGSKFCKKGSLLDPFEDDVSESSSLPLAGTSINKQSHETWKPEPAPDKVKLLGGLTFSGEEMSQHKLALPLQDSQEQASMESDHCSHQKGKDFDMKVSPRSTKEATEAPTPAQGDGREKLDDRNKRDKAAFFDLDVKSSKNFPNSPNQMEVNKFSSKHEIQEQHLLSVEKTDLGMKSEHQLPCKEAVNNEIKIDEDSEIRETSKTSFTEEVKRPTTSSLEESSKHDESEKQKNLVHKLDSRLGTLSNRKPLTEKEKVLSKSLQEGPKLESSEMPIGLSDARSRKSQESESRGIARASANLQQRHNSDGLHVPTGKSPKNLPENSAKRKFSGDQRTSDSPSSKTDSSKKLAVDEVSKKIEVQQMSDSISLKKRCKEPQINLPENHYQSKEVPVNILPKSASKLAPDRFLQAASSLNKTARPLELQVPRSLTGTQGNTLKFQEKGISLPKLTSPIGSSCDYAAEKRGTILGGLQSPSLPPTQQKRSLYQAPEISSARKFSSTIHSGKNNVMAKKKLEGTTLRNTSSLALLSKAKAAGPLRDTCEKTFRFDVESQGTAAPPPTTLQPPPTTLQPPPTTLQSRTGLEKLRSLEACKEKLAVPTLDKPDTEMADFKDIKTAKNSPDSETPQAKDDVPLLAVAMDYDDGIEEKSESYSNRLDHLLKMLKDKYEEAMDLRVRALVINNTFLMLSNPVDDEKVQKITKYVREKLCLTTQGQGVMQLCQ